MLLSFLACKDTVDLPPIPGSLSIESTSYHLPLNTYGKAMLKATLDQGQDVTALVTFYVNGEPLQDATFTPHTTGAYQLTGKYQGVESESIEIRVSEGRNKKVLVELFTSRTCGWCPWIGSRLDSLHRSHPQVIGYTLHLNDELEIGETDALRSALAIASTPRERLNRGYVRDYTASRQIQPLLDSIDRLLAIQPPLELAIESSLVQDDLTIQVSAHWYEAVEEDLFLTLVLVEDNLTTYNQANYFSGKSYAHCPYVDAPNPIPEYQNLNVLRRFVSAPLGDAIDMDPAFIGTPQVIGSYQIPLAPSVKIEDTYLIALVHYGRDDIEVSSVLNAQMVQAGEEVAFGE